MNNEGIGDELQRYAAVNNMMLKTYSQACLDSSYDDYVSAMKKKTWQSAAAEGGEFFRLYCVLITINFPHYIKIRIEFNKSFLRGIIFIK